MSTSSSSAPSAFAKRSTVTSTNGLARYFRSAGSGRNSTSRVVLSMVYRSDVSSTRAAAGAHSDALNSMMSAVVPRLTGRMSSAKPSPSERWMRLVRPTWMTNPTIDR